MKDREPVENISTFCSDCAESRNKDILKQDIEVGCFVKHPFPLSEEDTEYFLEEHDSHITHERMWIKVTKLEGIFVHGTLANDPMFIRNGLANEDEVKVPIDEIVDILPKERP